MSQSVQFSNEMYLRLHLSLVESGVKIELGGKEKDLVFLYSIVPKCWPTCSSLIIESSMLLTNLISLQ